MASAKGAGFQIREEGVEDARVVSVLRVKVRLEEVARVEAHVGADVQEQVAARARHPWVGVVRAGGGCQHRSRDDDEEKQLHAGGSLRVACASRAHALKDSGFRSAPAKPGAQAARALPGACDLLRYSRRGALPGTPPIEDVVSVVYQDRRWPI